ncbi:type II toxin-antitoxin system death-on-curing family toxin [Gemmatimonas sp.]|jgi:death-on-curing protein|uniref:type II toxin-antitoxin system death-on-curing family toxin n=1 Tax=Gemmatimonas sp. TaxID=1962908 RepID=UPI0037BF6181
MSRIRWVARLVLDSAHLDQLREHGGLPGIRDENALEAALARPQQKYHYEPDSDLATLAAAYAFGIAKAHPFNDGNKRAAILSAVTFLVLNGQDLDADEEEVVQVVTALAAGSLTEPALATWIHNRLIPLQL